MMDSDCVAILRSEKDLPGLRFKVLLAFKALEGPENFVSRYYGDRGMTDGGAIHLGKTPHPFVPYF